jgi:hypothetical protein
LDIISVSLVNLLCECSEDGAVSYLH